MIELQPHSYYQMELAPGWTAQGEPATVFVGKASFQYDLNGQVEPLEQSAPLIQADEYPQDDPEHNAPSAFRETVPFKQGAEIILFATAHCSAPRPGFNIEVKLTTENGINWHKRLAVLGPRTWEKTLFGTVYTDPEPLTELPIGYEYAFGGRNAKNEDDAYAANPVGLGYLGTSREKTQVNGAPLPQIEQPDTLIKKPSQTPQPQGLGPLPSHWHPRHTAFKSLDEEKAAACQYPFSGPLPDTAYHSAPRDQWFTKPLYGPAQLSLTGLTKALPEHQALEIHWVIPDLVLLWKTRSTEQPLTLQADTLIVDTQKQHLHLLYRHAFVQLPKRLMAEIHAVEPTPVAEPETAHG